MAKSRKGAFVGLANSDYRPFPGSIGSRLCPMPNANFLELRTCEVRRISILGTSVNKTFVGDAPGVLRWHHGGRRKGFGPVGQGLRPRPKRRRKGSYAHLRGLDQLYGPRRRDRRETRAEVGAGLLDRGTLRHGRRLRGTRRRSHERPPPGDQQLYGHHTNHYAPSLRRARDVGHPPEDRLSRPTSENTYSMTLDE